MTWIGNIWPISRRSNRRIHSQSRKDHHVSTSRWYFMARPKHPYFRLEALVFKSLSGYRGETGLSTTRDSLSQVAGIWGLDRCRLARTSAPKRALGIVWLHPAWSLSISLTFFAPGQNLCKQTKLQGITGKLHMLRDFGKLSKLEVPAALVSGWTREFEEFLNLEDVPPRLADFLPMSSLVNLSLTDNRLYRVLQPPDDPINWDVYVMDSDWDDELYHPGYFGDWAGSESDGPELDAVDLYNLLWKAKIIISSTQGPEPRTDDIGRCDTF